MSMQVLKILKWFSIAAISILLLLIIVWFSFLSSYAKSKLWFLHTGGRWGHYALGGNYDGRKPSLSPDNSKLVFSSPLSGFGDIYSINIDGSNRRRLTRSRDCEGEPSFSPDGSKICYIREHDWQGEVYVMDADGTNQKRLTSNSSYDYDPSFSPDSKKIVFVGRISPRTRGQIYMVNIDGSGLRCLTNNDLGRGLPTFSSDGKSVYYYTHLTNEEYKVYKTEIWKVDLTTLKEKRVGSMPIEAYDIQYSPDFKKIVFKSWYTSKTYQIYTANLDGTGIKQLTNGETEYKLLSWNESPSFSADGSKIIYLSLSRIRKSDYSIIIMDSDGSNPKAVGID